MMEGRNNNGTDCGSTDCTDQETESWVRQQELEAYESSTPMDDDERQALRRWVASGHGIYEHPGSRHVCLIGAYPPPSFLDVYRMDRELDSATQGMTEKERTAYVRDYLGFSDDEDPEEMRAMSEAKEHTPQIAKDYIHKMEHELFFLWEYIWQKGLGDEAQSHVDATRDEPIPFSW